MNANQTPPPEGLAPTNGSPIRFNVNHKVRVKLNDWGRDIFMEHFDRYGIECGPPAEDAEGWSEHQLWCLMEIFGPHMTIGMKVPFETEIELLPENSKFPQP